MRTESNAEANRSAVLEPSIVPAAPWRVTQVEVLPNFCLRVKFVDGLAGVVDLSKLVHSAGAGVFAPLADPHRFAQVYLDYGAVTWPGDLDLAPDAMYAAIQQYGAYTV